jgi:4-methylaminobutanoate oxidase (formaldehyde-forming)
VRSQARAVVIGGGVGGAAILYWLARLGWTDTVLVERSRVTSGSTFHSAGLVGQLRGSLSLTRMMINSVDLYRKLGDEVGLETGWHEVGSLRLPSSSSRPKTRKRCSLPCRQTAFSAPPISPPTATSTPAS